MLEYPELTDEMRNMSFWNTELGSWLDEFDTFVEHVKNNDEEVLNIIEHEVPAELKPGFNQFLEAGLLSQQSVLTESAFNTKHSRALSLYRNICKEYNLEAKV